MGRIKRGILGGFSGKVANVIGGEWKGIAYMRSQPLSVANPRTAGQVTQRSKFASIVANGSELLATIVKPLWDRFAQAQSGFNAFVSANIETYDGAGNFAPDNFVIGRGSLNGVENLVANAGGGGLAGISWDDNSGTGTALGTDVAYAVSMGDDGTVKGQGTIGIRSDGAGNLQCENVDGVNDRVYLAFRRADGSLVSDSAVTQYFQP